MLASASVSSANILRPPRALRRDRHRLEHHPCARRGAAVGPAPQGDGAAGLHADRQGLPARRTDRRRERSARSPRSSRPRFGSPRRSAPRRSGSSPRRRSARPAIATSPWPGSRPRRGCRSRSSARRRRAGWRSSARPRHSVTRSTARSAWSTSAAALRRSSSAPSPGASARCGRSRSAPGPSRTTSSRATPVPRGDPQAPRAHRRFLRRYRRRPSRAGGRGRRQRDLALEAGRDCARVRDARARGAGPCGDPMEEVARRFELDARRVKLLPPGCFCSRRCRSSLASRFRSARAACAKV